MIDKFLFYIYVIGAIFSSSFGSIATNSEETSIQHNNIIATKVDKSPTENNSNVIESSTSVGYNIKNIPKSNLPKARNFIFHDQQFQNIPITPVDVMDNAGVLPLEVDLPSLETGNNPDSLNFEFDEDLQIPDAVYPSDNGDLAAAESGLVFRPLFAYRKQTAKRKRIYGNNNRTPPQSGQRRRETNNFMYYSPYGYYYRYPSQGYNYYYPKYYYEAQWDHVA